MRAQKFEVGKVLKAHGLKGEVKAAPFTDDPHRFDQLDWVYIDQKKYYISRVKYNKNTVIIKFEGIETPEDGEKLYGKLMEIDRENAVQLPANSYFIKDLLKMEVFDPKREVLGILTDVISTGSNDVYVVKNRESGREVLVPALRSVVLEVNTEDGYMIVQLPEGL